MFSLFREALPMHLIQEHAMLSLFGGNYSCALPVTEAKLCFFPSREAVFPTDKHGFMKEQ